MSETLVRLDGVMADDLSVINAARVSFGKHRTTIEEADRALINFLMRERHGTPFEHNAFRFHIKCPIFVAREWFRHRIGSFNELSARYTEVTNSAWLPDSTSIRTQVGKPGAYAYEQITGDTAIDAIDLIEYANKVAFNTYRDLLDMGIAKEVARTVLPVGTYTEFYWTVNARSLMNFLSLRTSSYAQKEIRDYALLIEGMFAEHMPITYEAWNRLGRSSV